MVILYSEEFRRELKKLPKKFQIMFSKQIDKFQKNWKDSRLHVKKLAGDPTTFSLRITSSYRALFYFVNESTCAFITIGHRKDVYRKK